MLIYYTNLLEQKWHKGIKGEIGRSAAYYKLVLLCPQFPEEVTRNQDLHKINPINDQDY